MLHKPDNLSLITETQVKMEEESNLHKLVLWLHMYRMACSLAYTIMHEYIYIHTHTHTHINKIKWL